MLDISQAELAKAIELSVAEIQKFELGHSRISAGTLYVFCAKLDVPMAWFFVGYTENQHERDDERRNSDKLRHELALLMNRASGPVQEQIVSLTQLLVEQDEMQREAPRAIEAD
jgi:transcriptional regulator with XRE-family HTH domain